MLEVNSFQQENDTLLIQTVKFNMTQLKNGNFVLSNAIDHYRLKSILSTWQKSHSTFENLDVTYKAFLKNNIKMNESLTRKSSILEN